MAINQTVDANKVIQILKGKISDLTSENAFFDVALGDSLAREMELQAQVQELREEVADLKLEKG